MLLEVIFEYFHAFIRTNNNARVDMFTVGMINFPVSRQIAGNEQ